MFLRSISTMKMVSFIVALCMVALVLHADAGAAPATGSGGHTQYCATAFDKMICEKLVKGSVNWEQAMTKGLTEAMKHVDLVILKSKSEKLGDSCCGETYVNIQARLKECMELVRKGDSEDSINFKLSAAITGLEDCKNALQDMKEDKNPFYVINRNFNHVLKICLAIDKSKHVKAAKN